LATIDSSDTTAFVSLAVPAGALGVIVVIMRFLELYTWALWLPGVLYL
jgi:hypothetical protein